MVFKLIFLKNLNCFIFISFVFCLFQATTLAQGIKHDPLVSVSCRNEPVSQVLEKLARNTGITFSYNPDHIEATRLISLNMDNRRLSAVLAEILPAEKFGLRQNGNQIVIFRKNPALTDLPGGTAQDAQQRGNLPVKPDTVFMTRTMLEKDTVTVTVKDTLVRFDTVYIMKVVTRDVPIKGADIFSNLTRLSDDLTRELKFQAGIHGSWLGIRQSFNSESASFTSNADYKNAYSPRFFSGSAGVDFSMFYSRFEFRTGISCASLNSRLEYSFEKETGGFFRKDTLDAYYTLENEDTTWFYVMDSTYMPVDLEAYTYSAAVSQKFLEIPFTLQYNQPAGRLLIFVRAGLIAGFHLGSKGLILNAGDEGVSQIRDLKYKPVVLSYTLGAGLRYPLPGRFIFEAGLKYRGHLESVFDGYPVELRYRAFGIDAGLIWKLY